MSSELEAAGAAITAGIAASTLERKEGGHAAHGPCANCGAEVNGRFCANCGQPGHVHRNLGHFIEEALHGVLHFDTKAWRTLPMLAFRPGTLTRRYTMGERTRFISPVALFLFTVFLMFLVFALMGENQQPGQRPSLEEQRASLAEAQAKIAEAEQEVAETRAKLEAARADPNSPAGVAAGLRGELVGAEAGLKAAQALVERRQTRLKEADERIAMLTRARDQLKINRAKEAAEGGDPNELKSIDFSLKRIEEALADPAGPPSGLSAEVAENGDVTTTFNPATGGMAPIFEQIREANANGDLTVNFGNEKWNEKVRHKLENPELAWYKIENTAYKFSFLLIPISLPFVWLMFAWKRGTTLFDHSVFVLYSLSFVSLLLIVMLVMARNSSWLAENVVPLLGLAVPVHMFFQIKGGYALGVFSSLWRTVYLLWASFFSLMFFLLSILFLGLLG